MFKWACQLTPTMSVERKAIRLSFMDSLTEQMLGGVMSKNGVWIPNSHIRNRITILHKACTFFFYGDRKLRLHGITNALAACASRNFVDVEISQKCTKLANYIHKFTENWQEEVISFLKDQVNSHDRSYDRSYDRS